jgi:hypothetical protein
MSSRDAARAFDHAMRLIARLAISGASATDGAPLASRLDELAARLREGRRLFDETGQVDQAWLRSTIRETAAWLPDEGLPLLAALGRIARAAPPRP